MGYPAPQSPPSDSRRMARLTSPTPSASWTSPATLGSSRLTSAKSSGTPAPTACCGCWRGMSAASPHVRCVGLTASPANTARFQSPASTSSSCAATSRRPRTSRTGSLASSCPQSARTALISATRPQNSSSTTCWSSATISSKCPDASLAFVIWLPLRPSLLVQ